MIQQNQFSAAQDVVGVFSGFSQVFRDARPMGATIKEEAKLMDHPTERGVTITDHMVIQPVEIELVMTLTPDTYKDTFQEIKRLFQSGELLSVQTKAETYENQVIQGMPHDETPDVFDTVDLSLKLREVLIVAAEYEAGYSAQSPRQTPTSERGEVPAQEESKGSWASKHLPLGK